MPKEQSNSVIAGNTRYPTQQKQSDTTSTRQKGNGEIVSAQPQSNAVAEVAITLPDARLPAAWIPTGMACAILTTICCFFPLGIIAIVRSAECRMARKCGDLQLAVIYSKKAKYWIFMSTVIGIVVNAVYVFFWHYYITGIAVGFVE